jgi:hypothetical protein
MGPYLVFADWLEEDNQSKRAEVIRRSCREARLKISWDDWLKHADTIRAQRPFGRVLLTTWPELRDGPTTVRIDGVKHYVSLVQPSKGRRIGPVSDRFKPQDYVPSLLAAEWPGLTFELPDDVRPTRSRLAVRRRAAGGQTK